MRYTDHIYLKHSHGKDDKSYTASNGHQYALNFILYILVGTNIKRKNEKLIVNLG